MITCDTIEHMEIFNQTRLRIYKILEPAEECDLLSRLFDFFIIGLILANIVALILESVPEHDVRWDYAFARFELVSVAIFTAEYILRVWSCVENPKFQHPIRGRIRFILTPYAIVDLLAIAPFYLPFFGWDLRFVRTFRVLRLARLAKLARYMSAVQRIQAVILDKRDELAASLSFMMILLIVSSCLLYFAEHEAQPEHFGSIPESMWWAIVTLTTVGYGDVYPITVAGKLLAAVIALLGIGMVALPTSILGSGFIDANKQNPVHNQRCPHCGEQLEA